MTTQEKSDTESLDSTVKVKLLDPLGRGIDGLKYHVMEGQKIVGKGVTDAQGNIAPVLSKIGTLLTLHVERFASAEMKMVKSFMPWSNDFSVKLLSSKVKEAVPLVPDSGSKGEYKRKTYTVKAKDTLGKIANDNGTTAQAIATLNGMTLNTIIHIGQVLKLPIVKDGASSVPSSTAPSASGNTSITSAASPANTPPPATAPGAVPAPQPPAKAEAPAQQAAGSSAPGKASADQASAPASTDKVNDRGENGTPKATVNLVCDQSGCIKLGDTGPLIEELNIRLTGFGGTILPPKKLNEYTTQTENAVKQFQRDYMGVAETGRACGAVLSALDAFAKKYPLPLAQMKCKCGKCAGFGNGYVDSEKAKYYKKKDTPYTGTEYPGMHRCLLWMFRAALFYVGDKDKSLEYSYLDVSSAYRCWHDNKKHSRHTTNHMGNALDVRFKHGNAPGRCDGTVLQTLRDKIFIKRLGGQMGWAKPNRLSLEPADIAPSWVHFDVREYATEYKQDRYYATTQGGADGESLMDIAKRESRLKLVNCGGIPPKASPAKDDRIAIEALKLSQAGMDFIKGWESFGEKPYDDSEHYCTIGWGHLIAKKSCAALASEGNSSYEKYKNGISDAAAAELFKKDLSKITDKVSLFVQVPLYQQEYDALVSLAYNTGGFSKFPKLISKLNTRDYSGCCDEFADITNHGTTGLVKRRQAEMKIFRNNVYDSTH
jgi:GH24 family phage-related lysozyme (muramidase)/LysM repeat protein